MTTASERVASAEVSPGTVCVCTPDDREALTELYLAAFPTANAQDLVPSLTGRMPRLAEAVIAAESKASLAFPARLERLRHIIRREVRSNDGNLAAHAASRLIRRSAKQLDASPARAEILQCARSKRSSMRLSKKFSRLRAKMDGRAQNP